MPQTKPLNVFQKLKIWVSGRGLDPTSRATFHNVSLIAFFAWVGLGADGLSSASYGPEEAFRVLVDHPHLGLLVALGSALTVLIISASYTHLIELFPAGGGGYLVASKLLSPRWGMISGCALIIDYVLTITISVASGAAAIFSFLPVEWLPYKIPFAVAALVALIILNLRGVKESIVPLVPIFLVFILTHAFAVLYGLGTHLWEFPTLVRETVAETGRTHNELGLIGMILLLLRSYSMGAGTYTGIEAVSNGMNILREPRVQTGKRTMLYMASSLAFMVMGLMACYVFFNVQATDGKTMNAVFFESLTSGWNPMASKYFVWITLFTEAAILFVAAQAGFLGGPRVLANMALDQWFPTRFTLLSDRLVSQNGVLLMGLLAGAVLLLTGASVHYLVILYSITVFITFVLSQAGLAKHWWTARAHTPHWKRRLGTSLTALALCSFILVVVTILKFFDGGWITLVALLLLVGMALMAKRYYESVNKTLKKMDSLVQAAQSSQSSMPGMAGGPAVEECKYDPKAKTAVVLVSGFDGLGLHTLFSIIRLFGGVYKNFIFMEVGLIDAGTFKGEEEVEHLKKHVNGELDKYVDFIRRHGYYGEGVTVLSHDVVEGSAQLAPEILQRFPQAVFFMGQLVFPEETWVSRLFHNNTVFAVQRRLYHLGIPFLILPIRVKMRG